MSFAKLCNLSVSLVRVETSSLDQDKLVAVIISSFHIIIISRSVPWEESRTQNIKFHSVIVCDDFLSGMSRSYVSEKSV